MGNIQGWGVNASGHYMRGKWEVIHFGLSRYMYLDLIKRTGIAEPLNPTYSEKGIGE